MNKIIITKWQQKIVICQFENNHLTAVQLEDEQQRSQLYDIYIGKVKNIVKNINSAFVELRDGQIAYYSLTENKHHHFAAAATDRPLREGDEIIVQVVKDAVKTKDPVVSSNLSFAGRYCVLTSQKTSIGFSGKIKDNAWKEMIKAELTPLKDEHFGVVVRTNAAGAKTADLINEFYQLKKQYQQILQYASYRTCYSLLYQQPCPYLTAVRDLYRPEQLEIICDDRSIYQQLEEYLQQLQLPVDGTLIFYQDQMISLTKLYNLEKELERALNKKVWMKSGGYLIIEPTEALVVIDVNTGKYSGKKSMPETILKINLEAAEIIARQLKIRNLSGIIIIDFIDMDSPEHQMILLNHLKKAVYDDPVKTTVVGMTQLNLVEMTRKKIRKPLHELLPMF